MPSAQPLLPFGPVQNSGLFSNHWLENRLPLEPEWKENFERVGKVLDGLAELWKEQKGRVEQYGNEAGLEEAFIQPVLKLLGWKIKYQAHLRGRDPDYALFLDDAALDRALKAGRTSPEFWKHATLVADAKAWHVKLDRPAIVNKKREYPPEQIEWYLTHSECDFGILTNGHHWRLIPRRLHSDQRRFETYLEFDLAYILNEWTGAPSQFFDHQQQIRADFLRFYLFFSPIAFLQQASSRERLIDRAVKGSSEYRLGVGEGLRERVFEALRLAVEGFVHYEPNDLDPEQHLSDCREQAFTFLYRLLFIMFAEDPSCNRDRGELRAAPLVLAWRHTKSSRSLGPESH